MIPRYTPEGKLDLRDTGYTPTTREHYKLTAEYALSDNPVCVYCAERAVTVRTTKWTRATLPSLPAEVKSVTNKSVFCRCGRYVEKLSTVTPSGTSTEYIQRGWPEEARIYVD
jgi:aerobic-type carbon monoxide dehydrogenase small subunit (CoxS/CutS family)